MIQKVKFNQRQIDLVHHHAKLCAIGGVSRIRQDKKERMDALSEDQIVGQAGTLGFMLWLFQNAPFAERQYNNERNERNENPHEGDGGSDLKNYKLDVKSSKWRKTERRLSHHNLIVAPEEFHKNTAYVLGMVDFRQGLDVYLVGWTDSSELPPPAQWGMFEGCHVFPARNLRDMSELRDSIINYRK